MKNNINSKVRFAIVGAVNTALDMGIFLALSWSGMSPIIANYISTTVALTFSFSANKKYTFPNSSKRVHHQIILFLVVTLIGLWVLQPITIFAVTKLLTHLGAFGEMANLLIGKLAATVITLVWNYSLYSRVVFTQYSGSSDTKDSTDTE